MKTIQLLEGQFDMLDILWDYFTEKYGEKNGGFICERLQPGFDKYSIDQLKNMGYKIALMNGWEEFKYPIDEEDAGTWTGQGAGMAD